jgi:phosphomannomutase
MTLKLSVSGVRGIVGSSLTPEIAASLAKAFALTLEGGRVVLGTDSRQSRVILKEAVIDGLVSSGISVIDAGIVPTPTVGMIVRELKAAGAIVITASHNPAEWNGLKFMDAKGLFLNEAQAEKLFMIWGERKFPEGRAHGAVMPHQSPFNAHLSAIFANIDVRAIGKRGFRVAVDAVNGAGSVIIPKLLKDLGCKVFTKNTDVDQPFPHNPEPTAENIKDLCALVGAHSADIGFAVDPDGDRVALVTEAGEAISEEYSLLVALKHVLKHKAESLKPKIVVVNLSTTKAIDEVAEKFGAEVVRTKIGEIFVTEEMVKRGALIGGEGNGGVIWPRVCLSRDSLTAIALILEHMALSSGKISGIIRSLPKVTIEKGKFTECRATDDAKRVIEGLKKIYAGQKMDLTDGLKVFLDGSSHWLHVRVSNTEPIVRIIAEGKTIKDSKDIVERARREMSSLVREA